MAAARIAAVALLAIALLSVQLSAQPAPQESVTVQVTDITGAVIPGASIEIDPSPSRAGTVLTTDSHGQTEFDLPAGVHAVSIAARGFSKLSRRIDVQGGVGQTVIVTAKLEIAVDDYPCMVCYSVPEIPLGRPEPVFLSLEPLLNLNPLPFKSAKRRW
jgi:Carboxypeptidase regulatory-like domain